MFYPVGVIDDLWRYNVSDGLWTLLRSDLYPMCKGSFGALNIPSAANRISCRQDATMVWNSRQNSLIVYGGRTWGGTLKDALTLCY